MLRYEKRTKQHAQKLVHGGKVDITVQEETIEDALKAASTMLENSGFQIPLQQNANKVRELT